MKKDSAEISSGGADSGALSAASPAGLGWYFYGITLRSPLLESLTAFVQGVAGQTVQLLYCRDLAAVVSPVPRAEFDAEALRERLQNPRDLEAIVRSHEGVVRAIQLERTILPARLGLVFASKQELASSLDPGHDKLKAQLEGLEGCDEWGIKLYADRAAIRRRVAADDPAIRALRQERSTASPGRAYFLERKLAQAIEAAAEQALGDLAQTAYDRLSGHSTSADLSRHPKDGEVEILRAAFIVPRQQLHGFLDEVHRLAEGDEGLRCEYTGPWAPYSFTKLEEATLP
ncbi:MAG: GvpL/GvpF family gas vesicle protein [Chloroflexi bacterium]|nr:GvpL/GvpF family gas vesicle protein [Chloroflexota bacterium]